MSLQSTTNRNDYTGDGATLTFAYTYLIFAATDLQVRVNGVLKTITTDYTVTGAGVSTGGNVVFVVAPPTSQPVSILRVEPFTRTSNYIDNDPFSMSILNNDLDKLTMLCQQLDERVKRCLGFGVASLFSNVTIPDLTGSAGFFLQVNPAASAFILSAVTPLTALNNPMTSVGDLITGGTGGTPTRVAGGTTDDRLMMAAGVPTWKAKTYDPLFTTKGDLMVATAANVRSRLGAGADGTVLIADSTQASGLRYGGIAAGTNLLPRGASSGGLVTFVSGTSITLGPGQFRDDANTMDMVLGSALTMSSLAVGWVVGNNQPKIRTGVVLANGMTLHLYVIMRTDTNTVDWFFTDESASPTLPTNYTKSRRVLALKFGTGAQTFPAFDHDVASGYVGWRATVNDVNLAPSSTAAVLRVLSVPTGILPFATMEVNLTPPAGAGVTAYLKISDPATNDEAPGATNSCLQAKQGVSDCSTRFSERCNASGQVRTRLSSADASINLSITLLGYFDLGGRNT